MASADPARRQEEEFVRDLGNADLENDGKFAEGPALALVSLMLPLPDPCWPLLPAWVSVVATSTAG